MSGPVSYLPRRSAPLPVASPAPARFDWCSSAAALPGKTLHLALALMWLATVHRSPGVALTRRVLGAWGISKDARYDALRRLEAANLIRSWQLPGRAPHVILLEPGEDRPLNLG